VTSRYRSQTIANSVIGISISYQRDHLLARGLGLEHLRELLVGIARPLLRQGASLAYAGNWTESEENFTFELLRLISDEQEDNSLGGPDTALTIGRLYNHCAWPAYLDVTPRIEAQWINCCRIIRITQQHAGIADADLVQEDVATPSDRRQLNAALVLSTMRRLTMEGMMIAAPDVPSPEYIPPVLARVALAGRTCGFSGILPGIFEEALLTLDHALPLYLLGGFGGATGVLAQAFLDAGAPLPQELTVEWQKAHTPSVATLEPLLAGSGSPSVATTEATLASLGQYCRKAGADLAGTLNTGLDQQETRELLATCEIERAVQLVLKGLNKRMNLSTLPA
jgi:hypothetical protein